MKKCPHCAEQVQDEAVFCKHCKKDIPQITAQQIASSNEQFYNKPLSKRILLAIIAVIVIVSLLYSFKNSQTQPVETAPISQATTPVKTAPELDTTGFAPYIIADKSDHSVKAFSGKLSDNSIQQIQQAPINKRFLYRVVVAPGLSEAQVRATINKLIIDETNKDGDIDEVGVLVYDDKKVSQGAYTVAKADWAPQGKWGSTTPQIASSNDRSNYQVNYQFAK